MHQNSNSRTLGLEQNALRKSLSIDFHLGSTIRTTYKKHLYTQSRISQHLQDEMTLRSRGPVHVYYLYVAKKTVLHPFRVLFVLKPKP